MSMKGNEENGDEKDEDENEKDENEMWDAILNEKGEYLCKLWGVLMADSKTYAAIGGLSAIVGGGAAALGALSNAYCYIGVTEQHLNFVVVDSVNVRNIKNRISIPMECITKAEVKGGLLPGRKAVPGGIKTSFGCRGMACF